jgi:hypothetical protein
MTKIIAGGAALGVLSVAIATWLTFINVEQKAAATVTKDSAAVTQRAMILPLELMAKHGKNLPAEQWPAF